MLLPAFFQGVRFPVLADELAHRLVDGPLVSLFLAQARLNQVVLDSQRFAIADPPEIDDPQARTGWRAWPSADGCAARRLGPTWTGSPMVRACSATARLTDCQIHQYA